MNEKNDGTALDNTVDDIQESRDDNLMDVTMLKKRTTTRTRSMGRVAACFSRNAGRGGHPRMPWVTRYSRNARRGGHPHMLWVIL